VALLENQRYERLFYKCAIVCFSARIASVFRQLTACKLIVPMQASEDSLMETLGSLSAG
jgi:uroporphyrinogen-III synthase